VGRWHVNLKDLNLFKSNYVLLFKDVIFPYVYDGNKPVIFRKENGKILVRHRNRTGQLEIDNGYHGQMPFNNDYYILLKCSPHFTNIFSASYARVESNQLNFDKQTLDSIANQIISIWDNAIENNYRNY
jgi:hypothetical protein